MYGTPIRLFHGCPAEALTDNTAVGDMYFPVVGHAMLFLFLSATMPDSADPIVEIWYEAWVVALIFLTFFMLGAITIMNMLKSRRQFRSSEVQAALSENFPRSVSISRRATTAKSSCLL